MQAQIVNYADDFVICCRGTADQAMTAMRSMMEQLKLTVNETKTHVCRVPDESFDFLGYTVRPVLLAADGPGLHGHASVAEEDSAALPPNQRDDRPTAGCWLDAEERVGRLNRMLRRLGELLLPGSGQQSLPRRGRTRSPPAPSVVVCGSTRCGVGESRSSPTSTCIETLGLVRLALRTRNFPWANA